MLLLERVLIGGADRHYLAHIHLVEGGQHGRGVLRLLQTLGDALAQPRHLHPLLALSARARAGWLSRNRGFGRGHRRRGGRSGRGEHVALGDAPVLAGRGNGGRIELVIGHQLARGGAGGGQRVGRAERIAGRSGGRARGGGRWGGGRWGRLWRLRSGRSRSGRLGRRGGAFGDRAQQRADIHRIAFGHGHLTQNPSGLGIDLERHLVGLELDQRLIHGNRVAGLLEPLRNRGLRHRFTQRGHLDFSHFILPRNVSG